LRKLRRLKATGGTRVHEMNTLFDTRDGALAREGKLVRIRVERQAPLRGPGKNTWKAPSHKPATPRPALLTYKGPVQGTSPGSQGQRYKVREEHEVWVEDSNALTRLFEGMGLRSGFRYEKFRSTYWLPALPGLRVELDETPIGNFLELEGGRDEIDRCAVLLGFCQDDYIVESYGALWLKLRQSAAGIANVNVASEFPLSAGPDDMLFDRSHS